jgi:hypothetical protein
MPRNHSSNTSASGAGTDDNGTKQKEEDADTNANDDVYGVMVKRPTGTKQSAADTGTLDTDASESATLRWAYECIKRDPNFNYEERMGGQDLPPGVWLGFIEMYQGLTARVLLKPDEIQRFRNAPTEEAT